MQHEDVYLEPAKILWTGGWDSTFQLLRLLFLDKRPVEPFYLIDESRRSTGTELLTMKRIRQSISDIDVAAASLLLPTNYFSVSQIPEDPEITNAFNAIKSTRFIGRQYDWLARYCKYRGIGNLQLCIHEDDKAAVVVAPFLSKETPDNELAVLADQPLGSNEHMIFKWFEFPILKLTKTDMAKIAEQHGWKDVMEKTWFCHSPLNEKPCGRCNPCRYTIEEGLAWRIPARRRFIGNIHAMLSSPAKATRRMLATLRK
jgi:hypothetical protein